MRVTRFAAKQVTRHDSYTLHVLAWYLVGFGGQCSLVSCICLHTCVHASKLHRQTLDPYLQHRHVVLELVQLTLETSDNLVVPAAFQHLVVVASKLIDLRNSMIHRVCVGQNETLGTLSIGLSDSNS